MLNFNSIYDIKKDPKRGKKQTGMDKIKKNFGFGMMRLPMNGEEVDIEETKKMVDAFWRRALIISIPPTVIFRVRAKRQSRNVLPIAIRAAVMF